MDLREARRRDWILRYTALYLIAAIPMIAILLVSGKSFLWGSDAYYQQYTVLSYTGNAVRRLLSGGGFSMVDLSLGQGMDVIGTLAYYGLTDPFQWLGALFQGRALEVYYHALIFFYIYLAGLLFCAYLRMTLLKGRANPWLVAAAGMMFAFCGYQTIGIIKNPYYASGALYLALMLICVERVLSGRRWKLMPLVVLLMLWANFYLAFQTTLLTVLYIALRLCFRLRARGVRESAKDGFILLGGYLLGFAMSMLVMLPSILSFFMSGRVDVSSGYTDSLLHYPAAYYLKLLMLFCAPYDYAGYWSLQSFCPIALFALLLLCAPKRALEPEEGRVRRQLRAGVALMVICLCVPLAGKVFNGFGYVTNRWSYGYAFAVCAAAAWGLPRLMDADFALRKKLCAAGLLWAAAMLVYALFAEKIGRFDGAGNAVAIEEMGSATKALSAIAGALALILASVWLAALGRGMRRNPARAKRAAAMLTALCCMVYSVGYALVAATSDEFRPAGIDVQIHSETGAAARALEGEGFYRVDTGGNVDAHAPLLGYNGTSFYWSLVPAWVSAHYRALELGSLRWTFRLESLGADRYLGALASVRYNLRKMDEPSMLLPGGASALGEMELADGTRVAAYENADCLPLGVVFDRAMSESEWAALDPVRKREALISCALLPDADAEILPRFEGELPAEKLDYALISADGAELTAHGLRAGAEDSLYLSFDAPADSEVYLRFSGTALTSCSDDTDARIFTETDAGINALYLIYEGGAFNYPQTGACVGIGYSADGMERVQLRARDDIGLSFDALEIYSAPADYARCALTDLRARGSWDAQIGNDCAYGTATLSAPGVLQIAIPYSPGWSAEVDGESAEILRCGGMYMGLPLDAGAHEVSLSYETPGLRAGAWISLAGAAVYALLCAIGERRRRRMGRIV